MTCVYARFPGQEHVAGNSKIPTIIYYDRHGKVRAAGAEAEREALVAEAEDKAYVKSELCVQLTFSPIITLLLNVYTHPRTMIASSSASDPNP